jgi:UDP-N-acetylmuramate--alanine ligase|uniref:UDP-N-acetylmuramate--L-alanine ligase n=1 Tax=Candidatus Planktophila sp. TaxID=2175601 RepID=UPI00404B73D4
MKPKQTLPELIGKRVHFIGIGGAGMSGLARIALSHGIKVSGSDAIDSNVVVALRALGANVSVGHKSENVDGADLIVFSTAISENNPERLRALELGLPIIARATALALLMSESKSIAVAGTHGKTTTSSMLTVALQATGADPSFAIGGTITASGSNAHRGTGDFFVAEADESDGSFVAYHPYGAIITNIEHDHVDFFADESAVFEVFTEFVTTIDSEGFLIYCNDDKGSRKLGSTVTNTRTFTYGTSPDSDLVIDQITLLPLGSSARAIWHGKVIGKLELSVPGHHNLMNAAAALAAGIVLDQAPAEMIDGLATFKGAGRRFEIKGTVNGIRVIDDYGHHPTEIEVTLTAARRFAGEGRLIVVFQPHRYSRTKAFIDNFATTLDLADEVIVLEIYAASEKPIAGISSETIVEKMTHGKFIPNFIDAVDAVVKSAKPGDVVITLGAGDVSSLAPIIVEELAK